MKVLNLIMLCTVASMVSIMAIAQDVKEAADIVIPEIAVQEQADFPMPTEEIPMTETVDMISTPTDEALATEAVIGTEEVKPVIPPVIPPVATTIGEETVIELPEMPDFTFPEETTTPETAPVTQ